MVVVKDDHLPHMKWVLGCISKLYTGSEDRICRIVDVSTSRDILRREFTKPRACGLTEPSPYGYTTSPREQSAAAAARTLGILFL
ncbi:hypothetical protein EVAR_51289_1 [Eumeta japonica]|uniref:DUF5641 domain-containing protein n=1 Tax=Eumeta variegata TaxID=151549 RepID=A0A4C1XSH9_EUMVA|nr:hypothetical protein EVAR_51289_1 [Eumeta japonica]